jgi:hypothetical protein
MRPLDWVLVDLTDFPRLFAYDVDGTPVPRGPEDLQKFNGFYVGIVTEVSGDFVRVHLVEKDTGFTLGETFVHQQKVSLLNNRNGVPKNRLATYDPEWQPRGAR